MSGPMGLYTYGSSYNRDWNSQLHAVSARLCRKYAKRSLNLIDGPNSAKLARKRSYNPHPENRWLVVPYSDWKGADGRTCADFHRERVSCGRSHRIPPEEVRRYCIGALEMTDRVPLTVEVEKIVEVEVGMVLSFEERDILISALHREQHVANEQLRIAYEQDNLHDVRIHGGRVAGVLDLMKRFGIEPDAWANGPVWLVDTNFARIVTPEQPGEVLDPQDGLFAPNGDANAL